jgi:hypothetical protein
MTCDEGDPEDFRDAGGTTGTDVPCYTPKMLAMLNTLDEKMCCSPGADTEGAIDGMTGKPAVE